MLRAVFLSMALCLCAAAAENPKLNYKFQPELPRSVKIGKTSVVTLLSKGKVQFEIVVPKEASPTSHEAGKEAAELLSEICGAKVKLTPKGSGKVPAIIIGDQALAKRIGLDISRIDRDGYFIKTVGRDLLIIGRDDPKRAPRQIGNWNGDNGERATLFGVYDFLERFAGVRFYFPGKLGTILPKRTDWQLPAIDIYDRPDKVQRSTYSSWRPRNLTMPKELGTPFNMRKYRLRMRYQTWTWPCCHGLEKQGFIARYSKSHPEYFARNAQGKSVLDFRSDMRDQLCFNSGIREEIFKDALAFLKGRPASERGIRPYRNKPDMVAWHNQLDLRIPVYDITPDDGYYPCRCPKCQKSFPEVVGRNNKALSNFMWRYYADAAKYVKGHGYIAAWIYYPTLLVPDFKLPDNLLFVMCPKGPWSCGNEAVLKRELERIKTWGGITGNRMRLWNYMIKYPHGSYPGVPSNAPRAVAHYYREAAPYICGAFAEVGMERFMFQYLNLYVYYKALWNTNLDIEALLKEHHQLLFGAAARPMAAFYDELEKLWLGLVGNSVDTPEGPKTVMISDFDIWTKRYNENVMKKMESFLNAAEAAVPKNSMEAARIRFIRREVWQTAVDRRRKFMETLDQKDSWRMVAAEAQSPILIDGKLDDRAWKNASPIHLTRFGKGEVEVNTIVKMLYDKENFYFAFENFEPDTGKIIATDYPADDSRRWANSTAEIFLNPDNTRTNFYHLFIDSRGKLTDYFSDKGVVKYAWNSGAEIKTTIEKGKKWIAEVRVPRKSMQGNGDAFPVNFTRHRARSKEKGEVYTWNPFMRRFHQVESWGWCFLGRDPEPSVIRYGDFEIPVRNKRWIGPWYGQKKLDVDRKVFLTAGASVKLTQPDAGEVVQRFKLKPDTEYIVSYFIKLENVAPDGKGGVRARFDECGGNVHWMPRAYFRGTMDWTRVSMKIKTSPKCGSKRQKGYTEYLNIFIAKGTKGTAWVDRVEIREIRKGK